MKTIEKAIIKEILDVGLAGSSWREDYFEAYEELLTYRRDMELSITKVFEAQHNEKI